MPVEFLTDEQAAHYGRYAEPPSRAHLDRFFHLDDADWELIAPKRRDANRLGFAVQLCTARGLGTFLTDVGEVPENAVVYLAEQLGVDDPGCLSDYAAREQTRLDHAEEIRRACGFVDFAEKQAELRAWLEAQVWTTTDGPKALFDGAVAWLRRRAVLLPGVTTLARLVARVREEVTERLWQELCALLGPGQQAGLEALLAVPEGERVSNLERLRRGPTRRSGQEMVRALDRVAEIFGLGLGQVDLSGFPARRVAEMARYGLAGKAPLLRRHDDPRRLATLLATVVHLQARAVDDALELLDLLMTTKLLAQAERESVKEKVKRLPRLNAESAKLAAAVGVLIEATPGEEGDAAAVSLAQVWERIESVVPRGELAAALRALEEMLPAPDSDADEEWRAELVTRYGSVRGFLPMLTQVIDFGATVEGALALEAMRRLPELIGRKKVLAREVDTSLVTGSWHKLVFAEGPEVVHKAAYVFCVLEQFHRHLKRRDIYAPASSRWNDPRSKLLAGSAWEQAKPAALAALGLPEDPDAFLAAHAELLDATYREVGGRLIANDAVTVDERGRLHLAQLTAVKDPPSLVDLRTRIGRMLPRVDLPELILEVMSWHPGFMDAFTGVSGSEARLADLDVTVAALLVCHSCNLDYTPVAKPGVAALSRDRLSHVDQTYLRAETYSVANVPLIEGQAGNALALAWGGGRVASVDGMRFVVPVNTIHSRPNRRYFGRRRGSTWLNMVNDQAAGLSGMVVAGTPRDTLHLLDVLYNQDGGLAPDIIVTDEGSYSDLIFGLVHLLGRQYRPQLADVPDHRLWRVNRTADYGPLDAAARGRIDTDRIRRHWDDICRVVASIHTGAVRAYDVIRMLSRDGNPTQLGLAIAHFGRLHKSLHVLSYIDDESYRRAIKAQTSLQESRHALARWVFHGKHGELRQRYRDGMEDQLGALGLVLNCITLWNTVYMDAALDQLRAEGYPVREEDVVYLSPFARRHINVNGHYSFLLPDMPGGRRELRDPDEPLEGEEE
ncbi:Tn3 family transposase [Salinactinospora qingdaonensis]|uniref:Tn3-like element Tn3 family transposase n=1 Tax=Salinactinospora qingdaonensis TaxID=702744 RepID=A0ABP7GH26_9ACTN